MRSHPRLALTGLLLVVVAFLLVGTLYAVQTPAWQAPDEPAHYNYIRQLAAGHIPVMEAEDYDEAYRAEIVSAGFSESYSIEPLTYEDWQPPLYYLLQTPLFLLFDGALLPLRLFSLLLGAGVLLLTYAVARQVWPRRAWLALTATAFVAFLPQHVAMLASVNNDSLAELLIGAILWLLLFLTGQRPPGGSAASQRWWLLTGVLLGLGFLTKATVYIMAPVIALALLWRFWLRWRPLFQAGLLTFLPAAVIGSLWWGRNLLVYGWPDLLGKEAHDAAVVGQKQTVAWIAEIGGSAALRSFVQTTFQSFWGQFGWMGVVMDRRIYLVLLLFTLLIFAGALWTLLGHLRKPTGQKIPTGERQADIQFSVSAFQAAILVATLFLSIGVYLGYNVTYVQHQGRYLFPALIPISLGVAAGAGAWARPLLARWPRLAWLVPAGLGIALAGLDLLALFRFIVPALT